MSRCHVPSKKSASAGRGKGRWRENRGSEVTKKQEADLSRYFQRVEQLLRRSLGVSLSAKGAADVRPAPPTAVGPIPEEGVPGDEGAAVEAEAFGDANEWVDWQSMKAKMEHDEL
jgi:heat shock protein beta